MKLKLINGLAIVLLVITGPYWGYGQTLFAVKSFKASVSGTSTLHEWESQITKTECTCLLQKNELMIKTIKDIRLKIPVEGIKSKEGKIMDEKTFEAFNSIENPFITFTASDVVFALDVAQAAVVDVNGDLTMAGTTRAVILEAHIHILPSGELSVSVSKKLRMTDFNMKPPNAVLGTIKVGDEVTINIDLLLSSESTDKSKIN